MSSGTTFLLWLAWVAGGTGILVLLVIISDRLYEKRIRPLMRTLRCPGCGGGYDGARPMQRPDLIVRVLANPAPGTRPPPPPPPPPRSPPKWQVTCPTCGLNAVYTEQGQLQQTHRPAASLPPSA